MVKLYSEALLLALIIGPPAPATAEVNVHIGVPAPPAVVLPALPALVVIPETYIYAAPDIEEDVFFYRGWWWRSRNGHWYRSKQYNSDWTPYRQVPSFYRQVPATWRDDYQNHRRNRHR
ncbi:MAG: hypothetical protein CVU71_04455 [Deltaproteobacteria bacterium HGW-Deltaproteobacteria-6]|jgi:hypothetical protein|nr:MAG: hypothetical protein CVU71_04455 [Deltaproteobacteria bacterium HGW-Deltaproteobacteria-6]